MIANEHQAKISRKSIKLFEESLAIFDKNSRTTDPILRDIERGGIEYRLEELRIELKAYEDLKNASIVSLGALNEFSNALIKARIASRLSQKQLAKRVGLNVQSIQRYEMKGYTNASLARIIQVANAMGLAFSGAFDIKRKLPGGVIDSQKKTFLASNNK